MKLNQPSGSAGSPRGFTLIECLVYIAVLLLVWGLAFQLFYRSRDSARDLGRNADDVSRAVHAGERWREDVRLAIGRVDVAEVDGVTRLRIPQADGAVVYSFHDAQVFRESGGATIPVLGKVKASRMQSDPREKVTAWRWELELLGRPDRKRLRPLFSFQAVAGGGPVP
jgi:hypothetical protein